MRPFHSPIPSLPGALVIARPIGRSVISCSPALFAHSHPAAARCPVPQFDLSRFTLPANAGASVRPTPKKARTKLPVRPRLPGSDTQPVGAHPPAASDQGATDGAQSASAEGASSASWQRAGGSAGPSAGAAPVAVPAPAKKKRPGGGRGLAEFILPPRAAATAAAARNRLQARPREAVAEGRAKRSGLAVGGANGCRATSAVRKSLGRKNLGQVPVAARSGLGAGKRPWQAADSAADTAADVGQAGLASSLPQPGAQWEASDAGLDAGLDDSAAAPPPPPPPGSSGGAAHRPTADATAQGSAPAAAVATLGAASPRAGPASAPAPAPALVAADGSWWGLVVFPPVGGAPSACFVTSVRFSLRGSISWCIHL